jgi:hypothetical protein
MCSEDVGGVLDQSYSDDLSFADLFKQMASKQVPYWGLSAIKDLCSVPDPDPHVFGPPGIRIH